MIMNNTQLRVATFIAQEQHYAVTTADGVEWFRDNKRSTASLDELINKFLEDNKATPVQVSAPNVSLISATPELEPKQRAYRITASLIYNVTNELVIDESRKARVAPEPLNKDQLEQLLRQMGKL